jgi:uncharacterized protein (DUF1778 family)
MCAQKRRSAMKVKPTEDSAKAGKTDRLFLRASAAQKSLIAAAAAASHKTASEFILDIALREASNTLLDKRIFFADEQAFAVFEEALDAPAQPNSGLTKLLSKSAPWE